MSNMIQSDAGAVNRVVSSRSEAAFPAVDPRRQKHSADQSMMYAWSIGTTRAAQERGSERPVQREECPPEVYIG